MCIPCWQFNCPICHAIDMIARQMSEEQAPIKLTMWLGPVGGPCICIIERIEPRQYITHVSMLSACYVSPDPSFWDVSTHNILLTSYRKLDLMTSPVSKDLICCWMWQFISALVGVSVYERTGWCVSLRAHRLVRCVLHNSPPVFRITAACVVNK